MIFKKSLKYFAIIFILIIALELVLVAMDKNFFQKQATQEATRLNLKKDADNAIKHAYAASLVYSGLRQIFFSEKWAKNVVIFLGKANEIAEVIFKPHSDSSLEMAKDFYNNLVGISAAQFLETKNIKQNRINVIGDLASRNILLLSREDLILNDDEKYSMRKSYNYKLAQQWFDKNYEKIAVDISQKMIIMMN